MDDLPPKRRFVYLNEDGTIQDFNGVDPSSLKEDLATSVIETVHPKDPESGDECDYEPECHMSNSNDLENEDVSEEVSN